MSTHPDVRRRAAAHPRWARARRMHLNAIGRPLLLVALVVMVWGDPGLELIRSATAVPKMRVGAVGHALDAAAPSGGGPADADEHRAIERSARLWSVLWTTPFDEVASIMTLDDDPAGDSDGDPDGDPDAWTLEAWVLEPDQPWPPGEGAIGPIPAPIEVGSLTEHRGADFESHVAIETDEEGDPWMIEVHPRLVVGEMTGSTGATVGARVLVTTWVVRPMSEPIDPVTTHVVHLLDGPTPLAEAIDRFDTEGWDLPAAPAASDIGPDGSGGSIGSEPRLPPTGPSRVPPTASRCAWASPGQPPMSDECCACWQDYGPASLRASACRFEHKALVSGCIAAILAALAAGLVRCAQWGVKLGSCGSWEPFAITVCTLTAIVLAYGVYSLCMVAADARLAACQLRIEADFVACLRDNGC